MNERPSDYSSRSPLFRAELPAREDSVVWPVARTLLLGLVLYFLLTAAEAWGLEDFHGPKDKECSCVAHLCELGYFDRLEEAGDDEE